VVTLNEGNWLGKGHQGCGREEGLLVRATWETEWKRKIFGKVWKKEEEA
jgi:hypothetical protein